MAGDDEHVTVVISRRVRPGRHAHYEQWVHEVSAAAARFPGHEGISVLRPPGSPDDYVLVMRFASHADLRRWQESAERREHLERLEPLTFDLGAWDAKTGLETWFTLPDRPLPAGPPPRWRMAVLTTVGLYPLLVATQLLVGGRLEPLPFAVRTAITTPVLVAVMTWVVMPALTRLAYRWLYPRQARAD